MRVGPRAGLAKLVVVTGMVAIGACGGGGKSGSKVAAVTTTTAASTVTTAVAGGQPAAAAPAAGASNAPATTPKTTAKPAGTSAATAAPAPAPAPAGGGSSSATSPPVYSGKPQLAPGHYHYAASGNSGTGGPPPGSDLVVDPPQGSTQHRRETSQSGGGSSTTDTTYDYQPDGVHLVDLTTTTATSFGTTTLRFHPQPAPLVTPKTFDPGTTVGPFDMTSDDGKTVATVKVTVQSNNESIKSGDGVAHPTARFALDTTLRCATGQTCPFTGTLNSTLWVDANGLTIQSHNVTNGSYSGFAVKADVTTVVDRATPS